MKFLQQINKNYNHSSGGIESLSHEYGHVISDLTNSSTRKALDKFSSTDIAKLIPNVYISGGDVLLLKNIKPEYYYDGDKKIDIELRKHKELLLDYNLIYNIKNFKV